MSDNLNDRITHAKGFLSHMMRSSKIRYKCHSMIHEVDKCEEVRDTVIYPEA